MIGMMGGRSESPRMMQMRGEMMKAMGEVLMKYSGPAGQSPDRRRGRGACTIRIMSRRTVAWAVLLAVSLASCVGAWAQPATQRYPDVVSVNVASRGQERFDFDVTVSSPYDTAARYADAFRVMSKEGRVFGERVLLHDHAGEQPFTRDLYGVAIPRGIRVVVVQARDQKYGYGGKTVEVVLPGR